MVDKKTSSSDYKSEDYLVQKSISKSEYILYVITNENTWEESFQVYNIWGIGMHTGMVLENTKNNTESLLYDPSGSYFFRKDNGEVIYSGSGYIFSGNEFSFESYIDYQKQDGDDVFAHIFYLSKEEGERIKENILKDRNCGAMGCAECTSNVLQGGRGVFKDLEITNFPNQLGKQLRKISNQTIRLGKN